MNQQQITEDAHGLIKDYQTYGIDKINEISKQGPTPLNIEVIRLAAQWLQTDVIFADWAFVEIMTSSNEAFKND